MKHRITNVLLPIGSIAVFIVLWQAAGSLGFLPTRVVSTPYETTRLAVEEARNGTLWTDLWASIRRVVPGIVVGSLMGAIVGVATGRLRSIAGIASPLLHILRALPVVALTPIFVQLLGINDWPSKVTIIATGVFFPVWVSTHVGAEALPREYGDLARSLELPWPTRYFRIVIPATLGYIVAGVRTGIAVAFVMLFISEWIGANAGIGYRLSIAYIVGRGDLMILSLLELGLLSYGADALFALTVRKLFPWIQQNEE